MKFIKNAPSMPGSLPFVFRSRDELEPKILSSSFDPMIGEAWMEVSEDAKNWISKSVDIDPVQRLSAEL